MIYCKKCSKNIKRVKSTYTNKFYNVGNDGVAKTNASETTEEVEYYFECGCHTLEDDVEWWNKNGLEGMV